MSPERTTAGGLSQGYAEYTSKDAAEVMKTLLRHRGRANRAPVEVIADECGIGPRTVRAVLADLDGVKFVIATDGDSGGIWMAASTDDAEHGTRRLRSQAARMFERARRRDEYAAANLPTIQGKLI